MTGLDLERRLCRSSREERLASIRDTAHPCIAVAEALAKQLPEGTAPQDESFWSKPDWWERLSDWEALLSRADVTGDVFELLARRGLWHLIARDPRVRGDLLERAAGEARDVRDRLALAENPAAPESVIRTLAEESRRPVWELGVAILVALGNFPLLLVQAPVYAGYRVLYFIAACCTPLPSRYGPKPFRPRTWLCVPGDGPRYRKRLRDALRARRARAPR